MSLYFYILVLFCVMNYVFEHTKTYSLCFVLYCCLDALDLNIRHSIALVLAKELD